MPKVALGLMIFVDDELYTKLAVWLNDLGKKPYSISCVSPTVNDLSCV